MVKERRLKAINRMVNMLMLIERGRCRRRELTEEYGVSERTISRDINTLSMDFPIYYDNERGSYRFVEGYSLLRRGEIMG